MVRLKRTQQSHLRSMSILPLFNSYLTLRFFLIDMHFDIIHGMLWNFLRLDAVRSSRQSSASFTRVSSTRHADHHSRRQTFPTAFTLGRFTKQSPFINCQFVPLQPRCPTCKAYGQKNPSLGVIDRRTLISWKYTCLLGSAAIVHFLMGDSSERTWKSTSISTSTIGLLPMYVLLLLRLECHNL